MVLVLKVLTLSQLPHGAWCGRGGRYGGFSVRMEAHKKPLAANKREVLAQLYAPPLLGACIALGVPKKLISCPVKRVLIFP